MAVPRSLAEIEAANRARMASPAGPDGETTRAAWAYRGFVDVSIADVPRFVMFTNDDCAIARDILALGRFEPTALALWVTRARLASFAFDIGANTGIYSLAAAAANPECWVHAFEPVPVAFHRLRVNIEANGCDRILSHAFAIADRDGPLKLVSLKRPYPHIGTGASMSTDDRPGFETIPAMGRCLDRLIDAEKLNGRLIMKIDVEGHEGAVLLGGEKLIAAKLPDLVIEMLQDERRERIASWLRRFGYRLFNISETSGRIVPEAEFDPARSGKGDWNWFATCDGGYAPPSG